MQTPDHLDRAAEVIAAQMHGLTTPSMCRGIARALEDAGMLVTPERDEERAVGSPAVAKPPVSREDVEAVLKLAYKGTSDMDREPNWLGRVRRWARDGAPFPTVESTPEPASPERATAVAVRALREAADDMDDTDDPDAIHVANGDIDKWLHARADRIEEKWRLGMTAFGPVILKDDVTRSERGES